MKETREVEIKPTESNDSKDQSGTTSVTASINLTERPLATQPQAELIEINGRELIFSVKAYDEAGDIGEGIHKRFLVYGEKFTAKANSKI